MSQSQDGFLGCPPTLLLRNAGLLNLPGRPVVGGITVWEGPRPTGLTRGPVTCMHSSLATISSLPLDLRHGP